MANPTDLVITITARDQASGVLKGVRDEVGKTGEAFRLPTSAINAVRESLTRLGDVIPGVSSSVQHRARRVRSRAGRRSLRLHGGRRHQARKGS